MVSLGSGRVVTGNGYKDQLQLLIFSFLVLLRIDVVGVVFLFVCFFLSSFLSHSLFLFVGRNIEDIDMFPKCACFK